MVHLDIDNWMKEKLTFLLLNLFFFLFLIYDILILVLKIRKNDGWWFVQVLTGLTNAQLENLDMIEGAEYERKTVEVVLTVSSTSWLSNVLLWIYVSWDCLKLKALISLYAAYIRENASGGLYMGQQGWSWHVWRMEFWGWSTHTLASSLIINHKCFLSSCCLMLFGAHTLYGYLILVGMEAASHGEVHRGVEEVHRMEEESKWEDKGRVCQICKRRSSRGLKNVLSNLCLSFTQK